MTYHIVRIVYLKERYNFNFISTFMVEIITFKRIRTVILEQEVGPTFVQTIDFPLQKINKTNNSNLHTEYFLTNTH